MKRARSVGSRVLCSARELTPDTLTSGQAFRWRRNEAGDEWSSPLHGRLFRLTWTPAATVEFRVEPEPADADEDSARSFLRDYFRLDADLGELIRGWARRDAHFGNNALDVPIRQLRQDPFETLMSFICSQNNNIARITGMIDKLCQTFGTRIIGDHYAFPTLDQMAAATETQLRELGFGYRAPYIVGAIERLRSKDPSYLMSLRQRTLDECRAELTAFKGVGLKVADCVALFSLDQRAVVPVDTHVWQFARDLYKLEGLDTVKTLTPNVYRQVSSKLTDLWGEEAGWAHSFCFNTKVKTKRTPKKRTPKEKLEPIKADDENNDTPADKHVKEKKLAKRPKKEKQKAEMDGEAGKKAKKK